jgi:hypothetical protein
MNLKIKFIPYEKMKRGNVSDMLRDVKENTIILIDAKLRPEEEANLIEKTMEHVSEKFSGIELSSIDLSSEEDVNRFGKFRNILIEKIIGKKRGMTVVGPGNIIRKIKKNPEDLMLYV